MKKSFNFVALADGCECSYLNNSSACLSGET